MKRVFATAFVTIAILLCLWLYARLAFRHHREIQAVGKAKAYLAKGDYANASLCARQALRINSGDVDACRIMAEWAERARAPLVLDWRRRIVELDSTVQNKLMLASTALRWQGPPYPLAAEALDSLKAEALNVAAYHAVLAELALREKRTPQAKAEFAEASRLEPENEVHRLNLAVLQLQSTNRAESAAAEAALERLRSSTNLGAVALRWLVADRLGREDIVGAEEFSRQLIADPRCVPEDRLQHLSVLQKRDKQEFAEYLGALKRNVSTNPAEAYGVSAWMISHGLAGQALQWLTNFPARLRDEQPVPLALVDCYFATEDWSGLSGFLEAEEWGGLNFLRLAFLSKASAEQNETLGADVRWRSAVREAGQRLGPLSALLGLATTWGRQGAREELLWLIVQHHPREWWAVRELERSYRAEGNTRGLNQVYFAVAAYAPKNFAAENNVAATSLLLKHNLPRAHDLAKRLFAQHPDEAVIVSTYAYSLHLQGQSKAGLAAFARMKPEALEEPSVALYYGLLLAEVGKTNQASKYLAIARKADLLPEERALAEQAIRQLGRGS